MIVETRKTIAGTEYWDTIEKRSLFLLNGEEPGFEVIVNLESMIADTGFVIGGDTLTKNTGLVVGCRACIT